MPEMENVDALALLRIDVHSYGAVMATLTHMYPKLSIGGYVLCDRFQEGLVARAVHQFRSHSGVSEPLFSITGGGIYWRKTTPPFMPRQVFSGKKYAIKPEQWGGNASVHHDP